MFSTGAAYLEGTSNYYYYFQRSNLRIPKSNSLFFKCYNLNGYTPLRNWNTNFDRGSSVAKRFVRDFVDWLAACFRKLLMFIVYHSSQVEETWFEGLTNIYVTLSKCLYFKRCHLSENYKGFLNRYCNFLTITICFSKSEGVNSLLNESK